MCLQFVLLLRKRVLTYFFLFRATFCADCEWSESDGYLPAECEARSEDPVSTAHPAYSAAVGDLQGNVIVSFVCPLCVLFVSFLCVS